MKHLKKLAALLLVGVLALSLLTACLRRYTGGNCRDGRHQ